MAAESEVDRRVKWHAKRSKWCLIDGGAPMECAGSTEFSGHLREKDSDGILLRSWFKYFDLNRNGLVDYSEFIAGVVHSKYNSDPEQLWKDLDTYEIGEISLENVSMGDFRLWHHFRQWAGATFVSADDMHARIKSAALDQSGGANSVGTATGSRHTIRSTAYRPPSSASQSRSTAGRGHPTPGIEADFQGPISTRLNSTMRSEGSSGVLDRETFVSGLKRCGWEAGSEEVLFAALDPYSDHGITVKMLRWINMDAQRHKLKIQSRSRVKSQHLAKMVQKMAGKNALHDFKAFIEKKFGSTYRAWRAVMDLDGSMTLQRAELFKVCRQLDWSGDVKALWRTLDFDNCGATTIEHLDVAGARLLAQFKAWAEQAFGMRPSSNLWSDIDKHNRQKLSYKQFAKELHTRGFQTNLNTLVPWLDWEDKRYIIEDDLRVFDVWKPPAYLTSVPNGEAAEDLLRALRAKFGHTLQAWHAVMDPNRSNTCSWQEFRAALKTVKFTGDVTGAWLALDKDLTGSISLNEIDPSMSDSLLAFKTWCTEEFGNVRTAFKVMGFDISSEVSFKEFNHALLLYGYGADRHKLFATVNTASEKRVSVSRMVFLDAWEMPSTASDCEDCALFGSECKHAAGLDGSLKSGIGAGGSESSSCVSPGVLAYQMDTPGPGAYELASGFGAAPRAPHFKHGGAYSFTPRSSSLPWKMTDSVGPAYYDLTPRRPTRREKPAWTFGSAARASCGPPQRSAPSPGPGAYESPSSLHGPKFSIPTRKELRLHPHQKPAFPTPTPDGGHTHVRQCW